MKKILLSFLLLCSFLCDADIKIGAKAPDLHIAKWLKNGPVDLAEGKGKRYYLIQFWGTWCPPCQDIVPFLNYLNKKYAKDGLTMVAVSRENADTVGQFLQDHPTISYAVGVDDISKTWSKYMKGESAIPHAYLVNKEGLIIWKGDPLDFDRVFSAVLNNSFDVEKYQELADLRKEMRQMLRRGNQRKLIEISDKILEKDPLDSSALRSRLFVFETNRQYDDALDFIDGLIEKCPEETTLYFVKMNLMANSSSPSPQKVRELASLILDRFAKKPSALSNLASILLNRFPLGMAPIDLAVRAAKKSVEETNDKEQLLDSFNIPLRIRYATLAQAFYAACRIDLAVKNQQRSVELSKNTPDAARTGELLSFYRNLQTLSQHLSKQ